MLTLEAIKRRIGNAEDMQSVVNAMKVLAMVSIRQFEKSLASMNDYHRAVELGLQTVMANLSNELDEDAVEFMSLNHAAGHTCAIIFGSEQGLSGQFNERIAAFALGHLDTMGIEPEKRTLLALGDHLTYRLNSVNQPVEKQFTIHGSVKGMKRTVLELFLYIEEMRRRGDSGRILLFHHKSLSGAHHEPRMTQLLPLDIATFKEIGAKPWPSRSRPTFVMNREQLFRALIRQYLRVILERAFVESLVSENASRLVAMQVAEGNIADHLDELQHDYNDQRQSEITAEILDIVAGLEAVEKEQYCSF